MKCPCTNVECSCNNCTFDRSGDTKPATFPMTSACFFYISIVSQIFCIALNFPSFCIYVSQRLFDVATLDHHVCQHGVINVINAVFHKNVNTETNGRGDLLNNLGDFFIEKAHKCVLSALVKLDIFLFKTFGLFKKTLSQCIVLQKTRRKEKFSTK